MTTPFPFATEQFEWAGSMIFPTTGNTQMPFMASNSDDVFTPTSGRPPPQTQFFIPNSLPFHNNGAYNHFPEHFHTPTAQSCNFICDPAPHLLSPPLSGDSLHSQPLTSTHSTLPHIIDNSTLFSITLRDIPHRRPHDPSPECFRISNSEPIYIPALISPYLVDTLQDTSELDLEKYPMPVVIILFGTIVWLLLLLL